MTRPEVVGMISKVLFKVYVYLKERFDPKYPITDEEKYFTEICFTLIENPKSTLTIGPKSLKRFIKNDEKDIFVVIDNRKVTLINHVYCYSLVFDDDEQYFSMVKKFDEVLETKKQSVEDEMTNNVKNSLKIILSKVKNSPSKP